VREGLMLHEEGCWRLTLRGRLVSNEVFGTLLEGVAA
jgi:oxygen-independent coproporphyrinogen-3 oxidase